MIVFAALLSFVQGGVPTVRIPVPKAVPKREVNVWVSLNVAPSRKIRVNLNTRNVRVVHVVARPLEAVGWFESGRSEGPRPAPAGPAVRTWDVTVPDKDQRPNPNGADSYYARQVNLPPMKPGLYLLDFTGGDKPAWAVVNVTDLAVVVKRSPRRALVWVTDFETGKVVPGADVAVYRRKGEAVNRARTGADGVATMTLPPGEETYVVRRGADLAGITMGVPNPDGQLRAHFQTDRPIYRPGQKILFKAILRRTLGQGYAVVADRPCRVQLRDPKDNPVDEIAATSNAMGSVAGEFEIPDEGMTGPYTLVLQTGDDTAYRTLTVSAYRKPEFKVEVRPVAKRYLAGDEIAFDVESAYFFGAPLPQAAVHYTVRRSGMGFGGGDPSDALFYSGDGNLYAHDTYARDAVVGDDTVYTDANGRATIHLKSDPNVGDATYTVAVDVTDGARRRVSGGGSVPVYGASIRLGLSTSLVYASLGSLVPVTIRAVDLDGRPTTANVDLVLKTPVFDEKTGEWRERELTRTSVRVPAAGQVTLNLPAKEAGEIRVYASARDATKHTARASLGLYVAGGFGVFEKPKKEKEEPRLDLLLDRRVYEPGQAAKALVRTNHPGLPVLLVAEGGDLWDYRVLPNARTAKTWTVATSLKLAPNAYVTATQWVRSQLLSANVLLPVPDRTKALRVEATPDKTVYRPGERATYTLRTTDGKGKPVAAEVAMSVVDEAIYALSPDVTQDLYALYWGLRGNAVQMQASSPEELSGGAYQRVSTVAPLRQRFEDTAFWAPMVNTDANGRATVGFEMPGNLIAWRATARAVTANTSVGMGTASVRANRPVMLRLATPRQLVQGDQVAIVGTVNNRDEAAHDFEVELVADGVALEGAAKRTVRVAARGEGKVEWTLRADAIPPGGAASLTGQVVATDRREADYADALKVALNVVPNGLPERILVGGSVGAAATVPFTLPEDRIEPASVVDLEVRIGLRPALQDAANAVLNNSRYGSVGAADQLEAAVATGLGNDDRRVRESLALLSRTQRYDGWGRWESAPTDPVVTARVAAALASAQAGGIRVFDNLVRAAREALAARYNATNLWEHRTVLAAGLVALGDPRGRDLVEEVRTRGKATSPYARLRLAQALQTLGRGPEAQALAREVLKDASAGPTETFVPQGEGLEWNATDVETTAEALVALVRLGIEGETQAALARWLVAPERGGRSVDEEAALARALAAYLKVHPESPRLGDVAVEVNGTAVEVRRSSVAEAATARIPRELLRSGANAVAIRRSGEGEAMLRLEARVYRPVAGESTEGVRVLRRYEVKNAGGTWVELDRPVRAGEPVRCTAIAWGDDVRDAVRVVEPIPAGFEFVEDESGSEGYQEVRDGAVVHYLTNSGLPQTFRYYLRAESAGRLVALPATAEYLRRPALRGHTVPVRIVVEAKP